MPIQHPTLDELTRVAHLYHLHPTPQDLASFCGLMAPTLESYARLDRLTEPTLPVKYPRSPGARPQPQDNALGAWYWRCEITGAPHGLLAGKTVAIKDNVCVAGIPMMNGTSVLEGYVPEIDATLVTAYEADYFKIPLELDSFEEYSPKQLKETIQQLEADMRNAAKEMKFEQAAEIRDRLRYLRERELAVR